MSLFFNMMSRLVIAFLTRNKHLLISWLPSTSTVILEPKKIKSVTSSTFSPSICMNPSVNSIQFSSVHFSSLSRVLLCDLMDCSLPGLPVHHQLLEFIQTHVHWVGDDVQPCHPLSSPSAPAFNLSQNQGLFKWVSSSYQRAKVLEFQLQHQSFQWIFRTDFL